MQEQQSSRPEQQPGQDILIRDHLVGSKFVVRKGQFTINDNQVTLTMQMPGLYIECEHIIRHIDNECPEGEILQAFDKAVGGTAIQRGWHALKFPVWYFVRLPNLNDPRMNPGHSGHKSYRASTMIARTNADCHGNVVDGDQLRTDLDASPRTAATYDQPTSYPIAQCLSDLDELLGSRHDFLYQYHRACTCIVADRHMADDYLFTSSTDKADYFYPEGTRMAGPLSIRLFQNLNRKRLVQYTVDVSEMSTRFLRNLFFSAKVLLLQQLRQCPISLFSRLGNKIGNQFAISQSCTWGILCRLLPASCIVGINKCAFAHTTEIDATGKVILDQQLTLKDIFLGSEKIYAKVVDNMKVVIRGAEVDDKCMVMERRESLHLVNVEHKGSEYMEDDGFKRVEQADELLVGLEVQDYTLFKDLSCLTHEEVREIVTQASSIARAMRVLCGRCMFESETCISGKRNFPFGTQVIPGSSQSKVLRTAMVAGARGGNDVEKVEKMLRSIYGNLWSAEVRKHLEKVYNYVHSYVEGGASGSMVAYISRSEYFEISRCTDGEGEDIRILANRSVLIAAIMRTWICLGMRIEKETGQVIRDGNARAKMVLARNIDDDVIQLATHNGLARRGN